MSALRFCGMDYGHDEPVLTTNEAHDFIRAVHWCESIDVALEELFEGLDMARQIFVAIGGDWRHADLVRFAFERTQTMPDWVCGFPGIRDVVPPQTVNAVAKAMAKLKAARRRFIKTSHLVQSTGCTGGENRGLRALDRYLSREPALDPASRSYYRHCSSAGRLADMTVLNVRAGMDRRDSGKGAGAREMREEGHGCSFGPWPFTDWSYPGMLSLRRQTVLPTLRDHARDAQLVREDTVLYWRDCGPFGVLTGPPRPLLPQPVRGEGLALPAPSRGNDGQRAANIRAANRRRPLGARACKMVTQGRWRLVRQCE